MTYPARRLWLALLALAVVAGACSGSAPLKLKVLQEQLDSGRRDGARWCAPDDYATAEAYLVFSENAFLAGRDVEGEKFYQLAKTHTDRALDALPGCRPDLDGDGILDTQDADPYRAEDPDGYQDEDGRPEDDNDGDGFLDGEDRCPTEPEDFDGYRDNDGCPDNDNDFDGVMDDVDLCPSKPEDIDGWEDEDGCPDPDNDLDQVGDLDDLCPNHPETYNGFLDDDGCPDQLPKRRKFIPLPLVEFLSGSTYMTADSVENLRAFAARLMKNPEFNVRIESHTYSRGDPVKAMELTRQRAEIVKERLVAMGIPEPRLKSLGFGDTRPVAENTTLTGRRKNDRIEFLIYLP